MERERINVIDCLTQAISILNKTDEYLESLCDRLSECDSLISDYQHFIECTNINEINLKELYSNMQEIFKLRRTIKNDLALKVNYQNLVARLNSTTNRQFLLQSMNTTQSKLNTTYKNRILSEEEVQKLTNKKKAGRPKKMKEGL